MGSRDPLALYELQARDKELRLHGASVAITDDDDDVVFMAQPATQRGGRHDRHGSGGSGVREAESIMELPRGRFVAGEAFFNYAAFGSLREGLPSVALVSPQYFGLAFTALVSGFLVTFAGAVIQPLIVMYLTIHQQSQAKAAEKLVQWPGTLAVLIGLVSDAYPLFGFRRKSYIFLGFVIACLCYGVIGVVDLASHADASGNGTLFIVFSILASFGLQIVFTASLSMSIEFAQREHLYERGHVQALFFILQFSASAITQAVITQVMFPKDDGSLDSSVRLGTAAIIAAGSCLLPLPFLTWFLLEDASMTSTAKVTLGSRCRELWNFLQQKVVYCIILFLLGSIFLVGAISPNVLFAVQVWSGVTPSEHQYVALAYSAPKVVAVFIWKSFFVNWDWRKVTVLGMVIYAACKIILGVMVTFNVVRDEWFYYLITCIEEIPQGWLELLVVVIPTEIADIGREGATIGLVLSFANLISIASSTLWDSINNAAYANVEVQRILEDSARTRNKVFTVAIIYAALNILSIALAWFLPAQKLDAQQLRAFGGYNAAARSIIVLCFIGLLVYDLVDHIKSI